MCSKPFRIIYGGEWGPVTFPAFKAGDSSLRGSNGGFDFHTPPPSSFNRKLVSKIWTPIHALNSKTPYACDRSGKFIHRIGVNVADQMGVFLHRDLTIAVA